MHLNIGEKQWKWTGFEKGAEYTRNEGEDEQTVNFKK